VKTKIAVVLSVLVLGTLASAQTFGFASSGGLGLYCNYEQLNYAGLGAWGVVDNLSPCGAPLNATGSGFTAQTPNLGLPVYGKGVVYGDNIYDAFSLGFTGAQWTVFTRLKCNDQYPSGQYKGKWSWIGLAGFSGFIFGDNFGFLSCSIPGGDSVSHGTTVGNTMQALKEHRNK
jgi:hypothetical protein